MALSFAIGDVTIHRIIEQVIPFSAPQDFLPNLSDEVLSANRSWLEPLDIDPVTGRLVLVIQSYVVKTPHYTVLVDTCVGNDKERPTRPPWHMRKDSTYMDAFAAAGFQLGDIDYVMCTHMHVDHVGWNTIQKDGRWVPTFPNARYMFAQTEYDHWSAAHSREPVPVYADSVLPVIEAGRAEFVADRFELGDHIRLTPTPGHTPGHVALELGKGRCDAVMSGDLIHTRLQARYPSLSMRADIDPKQAGITRRAFLEKHCDTATLCCTAHFPSSSVVRIKRWDDGFRCEFVEA